MVGKKIIAKLRATDETYVFTSSQSEEEITQKWVGIGILNDIISDEQPIIARALELAATRILENTEIYGEIYGRLNVMVFPIIRGICNKNEFKYIVKDRDKFVLKLITDVLIAYQEFNEKNLDLVGLIDSEAQFTHDFCEDYKIL